MAAIRLDGTAAPAALEAMFLALERDTARSAGPMRLCPLVLPLHAPDGSVEGGLCGVTLYGWLAIQLLFVPARLQGRGLGTALVRRAEAEARSRGCHGAHVDTFDFQAETFFRRLGFTKFGLLEDFPSGHRRVYLSKPLGAAPSSARLVRSPGRPIARPL